MVLKAMHFTPEVMLSAPRRSVGVPNALGTKVLFTTNEYDFKSHKKTSTLGVLETQSGAVTTLARNEDISDYHWLDDSGNSLVCLHSKSGGITDICIVDAASQSSGNRSWMDRHYVAGTIHAPASNLKVAKLDSRADAIAVVFSAPSSKDGSMFNPETAGKTHSTGRLYKHLYVRHWDQYKGKDRNGLWYGQLSKDRNSGKYSLSGLTNALKDTPLECPIKPFGGTDNFDISHNRLIFVSKDPDLNPALHTKCNVYVSHIDSWTSGVSSRKPQQVIVPGFEGASTSPTISADGKQAAFLCMKADGYEADRNHIFVMTDLDMATEGTDLRANMFEASAWDRSPSSICFSANSKSILAVAEDFGYSRLFCLNASGEKARALTSKGYVSDCQPLIDGRVFVSGSTLVDNSFYAIVNPVQQLNSQNGESAWTSSNSSSGSKFGLSPKQVSSIWTPASNQKVNKEVHSIVVRPSNFDPKKKYPVAFLIHGGPQGSWADNWSTRWNPAVFAEQGYIVVAPNPTGSTGYGQEFTDSIRCNWGGDPYEDIVNCFEWVGKNMPEADMLKAVALGASYGGYMMNWIQGHDLGRKFKALVCHDGIFSTAGMLATEELYFPFTDIGAPGWADSQTSGHGQQPRAAYFPDWRKWDPAEHLSKWSTPEMIIHSEKDYRICVADGLAAFNVLQTRGIESQYLTFPDENHWVLKPENSLCWHACVLNWINKFVGLPPYTTEDPESEAFWGGINTKEEAPIELMASGKPET